MEIFDKYEDFFPSRVMSTSRVDANETQRKSSDNVSQKPWIDTKKSSQSPVKMKIRTLGPVVREKSKRRQLDGFTCKECEDYYKTRNLSDKGLKDRLKACSRHRAQHSPPKSPDHFWDTDFPTTPECIRRGIFNVAVNDSKSGTNADRKPKRKLSDDFCEVIDVIGGNDKKPVDKR
ncbi:unnamed protein product [Medioppia subpectinata]|uniref:DNA endonuclease activator Ctp1 C-terminal domain-containing protein n=1 Tax=Medioppia subpectinata TaxID=1979941 RepID=A0A7R9Q062_9ACAR|nr:unnamed protein product [Medioppia subpectinata]CAG2107751.1 unnamed protein product [Medioppia subpectinata]